MYKQHRGLRTWATVFTVALSLAMTLVWVSPGFAQAEAWDGYKNQIEKFMEKALKNLEKQSDLRFEDLDEALWAVGSIAKMKGFGIIEGYQGKFRPNTPVTQAEVLAMIVRALDLEEEAEELASEYVNTYSSFSWGHKGDDDDLDLDFDFDDLEDLEDGEDVEEFLKKLGERLQERARRVNGQVLPHIPESCSWAIGYILLAVQEGWVEISEISPRVPASRAWVSMVMVRALGEEDMLDTIDTDLPYKDVNSIAKSLLKYVAAAVELGLFEGYPEGTFKPNKPVTRAEMATIIERFLDGELPVETAFSVKGIVTALDDDEITIKSESGKTTTYEISPDALILVHKTPASVSDLNVGDKVELLSNGEGVALLIVVKEQADDETEITGEITAIDDDPETLWIEVDEDTTEEVVLAEDCEIESEDGDDELAFDELEVGDRVKVTLHDDLATEIEVLEEEETRIVEGVIIRIRELASGIKITVSKEFGEEILTLCEDVEITYDDETLDADELETGDEIEATVEDEKVTEIVIIDRDQDTEFGDVGGIITSISDDDGEDYEIQLDHEDDIIAIADDCRVFYGEDELDVDDLELGDEIRIDMDDDEAVQIRIYDRAD